MRTLFKDPKFRIGFVVALAIVIVAGVAFGSYAAYKARLNSSQKEGSDLIAAPALVGSDMLKARDTAKSYGFKVKIDSWVSSKVYPIDHIVSQEPLANEKVKKGTIIIVKVSSGKRDGDKPKQPVTVNENPQPLPSPPLMPRRALIKSGRVIVIDPGHQAHANLSHEPIGPGSTEMKVKTQGGTSGVNSRTPEYKITLDISLKLKAKLESKGVKVIMTREKNDVNLSNIERAQIANNAGAALFVRIHADGNTDHEKSGISTLYPTSNQWTALIYKDSKSAAGIVQKSVVVVASHKDNGIVARGDLTGFNWSKVPAILVETGFMTNPEEDATLNDPPYQDKLAEGICNGILNYLQTKN